MIDSEIASLLSGRTWGTPRFRVYAAWLIAPTLALSAMLAIWATWFGSGDLARPAQIGWAATLPVVAVVIVWMVGRSGTIVDDSGLVHITGWRSERLAWADIRRFTHTHGGTPGLGVITKNSRRLRVPGALHAMDPERACAAAAFLNRRFGLGHEHPRCACPSTRFCSQRCSQGGCDAPALTTLRTVEFRQTLRGYHIDDVDEYLESVAAEVDALGATILRLGIEVGPWLRPREDSAPVASQTDARPTDSHPMTTPALWAESDPRAPERESHGTEWERRLRRVSSD
jgi:DivIVA domain-containing protein